MDWSAFQTPWEAQEQLSGGEHDIYFMEGRVIKRHVAAEAPDFGTYFSYYNRMALHGLIFPETGYRLEGLTESPKGLVMTILSQPEVRFDSTAWVEEREVDVLMARRGFRKAGQTRYISLDGKVEVSDLHDENVVIVMVNPPLPPLERNLAVIDADINMVPPTLP